jgi:predicted HTH transcriptional regulator
VTSYFISGVLPWEGDVPALLKSEEGPCLEFKPSDRLEKRDEATGQVTERRDILDWMVAFGNNYPEGGKLVLGILDQRDAKTGERPVAGFTITEKFINGLNGKVDKVDPRLSFEVLRASHNGKDMAIVHVLSFRADAAGPYYLKGTDKTFFRDGASTISYIGFPEMSRRFLAQKEIGATHHGDVMAEKKALY